MTVPAYFFARVGDFVLGVQTLSSVLQGSISR